jgi:hypothetical protein
MIDFTDLGRMLVLLGGLVALMGLALLVVGRVPFLGRLPGDITLRRGGFSCYVPIVTSFLLSLLLTLVLNLIVRLLNR